jgi:hypothetical protein
VAAAKVTADEAGAAAKALARGQERPGAGQGATQQNRVAKVHSFTLAPEVENALDLLTRATGQNRSDVVAQAVIALAKAHSGAGAGAPAGAGVGASARPGARGVAPGAAPARLDEVPGAPGQRGR